MGAARSIDREVIVAAPVDAVWLEWKSKAGIESFFAPEAEIEPRVGGAFHIRMDPFAEPGLKGADAASGLEPVDGVVGPVVLPEHVDQPGHDTCELPTQRVRRVDDEHPAAGQAVALRIGLLHAQSYVQP